MFQGSPWRYSKKLALFHGLEKRIILGSKAFIEAHSEPWQTSKMERLVKITIFAKRSILDAWHGSEYAPYSTNQNWEVHKRVEIERNGAAANHKRTVKGHYHSKGWEIKEIIWSWLACQILRKTVNLGDHAPQKRRQRNILKNRLATFHWRQSKFCFVPFLQ